MQPYEIIISKMAEKDLFELFTYISENDYSGKAEVFIENLLKKIDSLLYFPEWRQRVQETTKVNNSRLYKIFYISYRITYEIRGDKITIHSVIDGRRNLKKILPKRLSLITPEQI
ncbi:MAG TPA: type II toxin-antitoxin system RelE/ParE family toxin [Gammaproteobacteria bacterium]|nr:type II toxin-antitoxin system RelE/ParE family toxin [Gammaproteobacteria bacterium]